ncbi:uncharacterized protein LOC143854020 [Tasmannia lanceolata]|uniref:uncharacterized protein LOC143854020 n=1 Tax=Tasmannia lanceolata TaxID=3420 RepID=UPI0040646E97
MDEKPSLESFLNEEEIDHITNPNSNPNHGWQKVTYPKRNRKSTPKPPDSDTDHAGFRSGAGGLENSNVFRSVEKKADERRRALEAQKAAAAETLAKSKPSPVLNSDDDDRESDVEEKIGVENGTEVKKPKQKKPKKPKITVPDAAAKIDASDLAAFLLDVSTSYESQQDIQLMRFADYFARTFSSVSASQFPWTKIFKESTLAKIVDIPLCYIHEAVYKTSTDWISQRSAEVLGPFVLWSLDSILADLASQQGPAKGSKKSVQQPSSKAQVAIFVVLAMVLRRKPDVLISQLLTLRDNPKYQGQDKLPVIVWMFAQACQGDLVVGMYSWVHNLLPMIPTKGCNPQSRDLILQLVERILSGQKARPILLNGAVRKGERLVPPSALELLMRVTFPEPSARVKATERFEAVYPTLKELALTGSPGTKAMKQVSQQLLPIAVKAMSEDNPKLSNEAAGIFIWCLTQNVDCYNQWENLHLENIQASVSVLRKLSEEWKEQSVKLAPPDILKETLKNLRQKNEQALAGGEEGGSQTSIKDADKYCKVLLAKLSRRFSCLRGSVFVLTLAIAVGGFLVSPDIEAWDWKKLHVIFSSPQSF